MTVRGWQVTFTRLEGMSKAGSSLLVAGSRCEVRPVAEKKENGRLRWLDSFRLVRVH